MYQIINYSGPNAVSIADLRKFSNEDEGIKKVKEGIFNDQWESSINQFKVFQTEVCFFDEILLKSVAFHYD